MSKGIAQDATPEQIAKLIPVLVPIRFGLKHSGSGQTRLYVIVDQNRINLDKIKKAQVIKPPRLITQGPAKALSVLHIV